jgi:hypothetical protein
LSRGEARGDHRSRPTGDRTRGPPRTRSEPCGVATLGSQLAPDGGVTQTLTLALLLTCCFLCFYFRAGWPCWAIPSFFFRGGGSNFFVSRTTFPETNRRLHGWPCASLTLHQAGIAERRKEQLLT